MGTPKHPIQPLVQDEYGTQRFQDNKIVRYLLDNGPFDLNDLAGLPFCREDREQFAQLIGYSLSGFGELSYVSRDTYDIAEKMLTITDEKVAELTVLREKLNEIRNLIRQLTTTAFQIHPDDLRD